MFISEMFFPSFPLKEILYAPVQFASSGNVEILLPFYDLY